MRALHAADAGRRTIVHAVCEYEPIVAARDRMSQAGASTGVDATVPRGGPRDAPAARTVLTRAYRCARPEEPAPAWRWRLPLIVQFLKFGVVGISNTLIALPCTRF